jgi:N-methylhydantoinase A/oxoprolinase/acetone carboxylase beta subunit
LPFITDLLRSVEHVLARAGIGGPLFVVRGDGSIMRGEVARTRAIETVLSGPAASAAGGRLLTGRKNALVLDMGGTTTDIAALDDGRMTLSREGARVGHWRTSVTAADIQTTGLGGDSSVRPAGGLRVQIGPERVVPLCFLAAQWPGVLDELASLSTQQLVGSMVPDEFDFFLLVGRPAGLGLDAHEHKIVELLAERPHSRPSLGRACGLLAPQLLRVRRLELIGLVRRAGVTPTDALHVLGEYARYDEDAARLGMRILGRFLGLDETATAELVKAEVERQLALAIMRHELSSDGAGRSPQEFEKVRGLLERALEGNGAEPFRLRWSQLRPVVGIGAPVGAFLPGACRMLGTDAIIPPDADVANALGAVTSRIVVGARIRIRPGEFGSYILYAPDGRAEFSRLEDAERAARERVVEFVRTKARGFGTAEEQVRVEVSRRVGRLQDGSTQLLEVEVEATLSGPPALARAGNA